MTRAIAATTAIVAVLWPGAPSVWAQHTEHRQEQSPTAAPGQTPPDQPDHSQHHAPSSNRPPFIPALTDEDRKAAFPDIGGHTVHDQSLHAFVLFDQLEWQWTPDGSGLNLDSRGWLGKDRDRLWFRAEGDAVNRRVGAAEAQVFYGRQIARWWDVVGGVRQDFRPGPARTWAAIGIQGLAPYWFEVEITGYIGASGRTHLRGEVEYELLLTNRLVLQPLLELELFGTSDPERGIGAGLSTTELGLRLRYEFRREVAPYVGVAWHNKWRGTADFASAAGEDTGGARLVTGLRLWF